MTCTKNLSIFKHFYFKNERSFSSIINKFKGTVRFLGNILYTSYFKPIGIGKRKIFNGKNSRVDDGTNGEGSRDSRALRGSGERGSRVIPTVFPHLSQDRSIPMLGESNVLPGNDFPRPTM